MAEWLRRGLQIPARRFDSGSGLHFLFKLAVLRALLRTVADLVRFGCGLKIECGDCGAGKSLDGYDVGGLVGAGALSAVRKRLRCSRCGARAAKLTVLPPI